jgi:hypothetical protein
MASVHICKTRIMVSACLEGNVKLKWDNVCDGFIKLNKWPLNFNFVFWNLTFIPSPTDSIELKMVKKLTCDWFPNPNP